MTKATFLFSAVLAVVLPLSGCSVKSPEGKPSVILIVVDTLRADHLGLYGYERETSPALDSWSSQAVIFERAFANSSWTVPAIGSLLTGRYPSSHRLGLIVGQNPLKLEGFNPKVPTLAEVLGESAAETAAYMTNPFLEKRLGVAKGFDIYEKLDFHRAQDVLDSGLQWIDTIGDQSFFLYVHLFEPHLDYSPPPSMRGRFSEADSPFTYPVTGLHQLRQRAARMSAAEREFITAAYDEEIANVDLQLGRFFAALEDRDLYDRCMVVVTSDHGEELFDHGGFEHGHTMFQELLAVPLIIRVPDVEPLRVSMPVSLVDVFPTVLEAFGITATEPLDGVSLWPAMIGKTGLHPSAIVASGMLYGPQKGAVVRWPYKLVHSQEDGRLYDLLLDPLEQRDHSASASPQILESLWEMARGQILSTETMAKGVEVEMDTQTLEKLRSLGYVQ